MKYIKSFLLALALSPVTFSFAQTKAPSSATHPVAIAMVIIMIVLAGVILVLGKAMIEGYTTFKKKSEKASETTKAVLTISLLLSSFALSAQDSVPAAVATSGEWIQGISNTAFTLMSSILVLELIIILYLARVSNSFFTTHTAKKRAVPKKKTIHWLERLNNTKSVDATSEAHVNLGHDYDGIGELDNPTPPWWQWGFVLSVVFAVVYLWVYFVSHSAPNQIKELELANVKAEEQIKTYLASSANKIDENTVTLLEDATEIAAGKKIFTSSCAPCHGSEGGGVVGPNLTDNYWLHGGTIHDIFKTIKNGVPEKGMKSWKDDFTPKQIAQLASFIISLKGTNPANPKEPQGDLIENN
jgi:cytochrome c oxidase cbb3-type subunit 3